MAVRRRTLLVLAGVGVGLAAVFLGALLKTPPTPSEVWMPQPDSFPVGTVLVGSRIELSLAAFTQYRPPAAPAWVTRLPGPLRRGAEALHQRLSKLDALAPWRLTTEAPGFLEVQSATLDYAPQGARAWVQFLAGTQRPGEFNAPIVLRLHHRSGQVQTLQAPVTLRVLARPEALAGQLLICQTPFEGYATDDGARFRPLANLTQSLAERRIQLDCLEALPTALQGFTGILLSGDALARLSAAQREALRTFVRGGGRLTLAANAFFVPTVARANELLAEFGLRVEDVDVTSLVGPLEILDDPLTLGVRQLSFDRPSPITVTDPAQGRLLVRTPDGGGYVAVSRAAGRGDVIVVTQSLWWNWIGGEAGEQDNARLLGNLLTR